METRKTCYDVGFWQYVYELEKNPFHALIIQKAKQLKALEGKDLFLLSETDAMKLQARKNYLTSELNVLYGFELFTDEMKTSYESSLEKIYDTYHDKIFSLETELYQLRFNYGLLHSYYMDSIESEIFLCDLLINKAGKHG